MGTIKILQSTDYMRVRLEKLFLHYGFDNIEMLASLVNNSPKFTFKDSELIIMDLDNYKLDVVSIIEALKREASTKDIPVMLLSSQSDIKTLKRAVYAGCTEFVTKPYSDELLMQKVHKLVKKDFTSRGDLNQPIDTSDKQEMNLSWHSDYEIGVEDIDREHKDIIDNYAKLYNYMKSGEGHNYYSEIIDFMKTYVDSHFAHEEAFQNEIAYPLREEHATRHEDFKLKVVNIIKEHEGREVTNIDLIKINLFLKDWIIHHILVEDSKIGDYLKSINK